MLTLARAAARRSLAFHLCHVVVPLAPASHELALATCRSPTVDFSLPSPTHPDHSAAPVRPFFSSAPESKTYSERRLVGYSPEQLYAVVSAVQNYHQFVPFCLKSSIQRRTGDNYFEAELEVGFQLFYERYTSKVTLQPPRLVRSTVSDYKLFDHLDSSWTLQPGPTPTTTWLSFQVDFAFRSPLYKAAAEMFFQEVVKQMMGAFEARCTSLYGPSALRRRATKACPAPPLAPVGKS